MSLSTFNCPYCTAENETPLKEVTTTNSASLKVLGRSQATTAKVSNTDRHCIYCKREYIHFKFQDFTVVRSHFQPKTEMLDKFGIMFPQEKNLNNLLNNIQAVTKPKQSFQDMWSGKNEHQHIIFILNGLRAYVDCEEISKTILRGLDIERV